MKKNNITFIFLLPAIWGIILTAGAFHSLQSEESLSNEELTKRVEILTEEVEKNKTGADLYTPVPEKGQKGLGPAASKVYTVDQGLTFGGYGEILYQNFDSKDESGTASGKADSIDMLRAVFYVGYRFNDMFALNTEIEIEHGEEIFVEFLYIDAMFSKYINLRAGMLLAPLGWINELHEPPVYLGAIRPLTEQYIIPSTWREIGAGLYGEAFGFSYRFYGMTSLYGGKFDAPKGLRSGRQKGIKAVAENFSVAGRLDYSGLKGFTIGTSVYYGDQGQDKAYNIPVLIIDGHVDFQWKGLYLRGLVAWSKIGNADAIFSDTTEEPGSQLLGMYGEAGYDILHPFSTEQQVILFTRYEWIDTQYRTPSAYAADGANQQQVITLGASYKPIINIVLKLDYQWKFNETGTGVNQFNVGLGYIF